MAAPTKTAQQTWETQIGQDFLQLSTIGEPNPVGWIDSLGVLQGALQPVSGPTFNWFNVKDYGAKGDTRQVTDAVVNGTTTVTSASAGFTQADVGKQVWAVLDSSHVQQVPHGTITAVNSASSITVSMAATASNSGVTLTWGTDDTAAIQAANEDLTDAVDGVLFFQPGGYICNANPTIVALTGNIQVMGSGVGITTLYVPPDFPYFNTGEGNLINLLASGNGYIHDLTIDGSNQNLSLQNIFLVYNSSGLSRASRVKIQNWQPSTGNNNVGYGSTSDNTFDEDMDINIQGTAYSLASLFAVIVRPNFIGTDFALAVVDTSNIRILGGNLFGASNGSALHDGQNSAIRELTLVGVKMAGGPTAVHLVESGTICRLAQCWVANADQSISNATAIKLESGVTLYLESSNIEATGTGVTVSNSGTFVDLGGNIYVGNDPTGSGVFRTGDITGAVLGFGNGSSGTAVTTTTKSTGTGPSAPDTIVGYAQTLIGGQAYWTPLFQ